MSAVSGLRTLLVTGPVNLGARGAVMSLIVQKYGGSSVGSIEKIGQVADRVARSRASGVDLVVVVSAMQGETDRLLGLAHAVSAAPDARETDQLIATGEQVAASTSRGHVGRRGRSRSPRPAFPRRTVACQARS